jgi:hypothetical protein
MFSSLRKLIRPSNTGSLEFYYNISFVSSRPSLFYLSTPPCCIYRQKPCLARQTEYGGQTALVGRNRWPSEWQSGNSRRQFDACLVTVSDLPHDASEIIRVSQGSGNLRVFLPLAQGSLRTHCCFPTPDAEDFETPVACGEMQSHLFIPLGLANSPYERRRIFRHRFELRTTNKIDHLKTSSADSQRCPLLPDRVTRGDESGNFTFLG